MPAKQCGEKVGFRWGATVYCHNRTRHPSGKCHKHQKQGTEIPKFGWPLKDLEYRPEVRRPTAIHPTVTRWCAYCSKKIKDYAPCVVVRQAGWHFTAGEYTDIQLHDECAKLFAEFIIASL